MRRRLWRFASRPRLRLGRLGDRILATHPDVRELMVLSNVGGRIAYSTEVAHEGSYRVQDEFFVSGREGTFVQGVYPSPLTLRPTVTVSTPLRSENLETFGILAALLDLEALDRLMQRRAGLGVSGETYLVDSYHSFISAERFDRERFPRGVHTAGIDAAIGGRDGAALYANYSGVPVIGVFRWIDDLDLALLVEVSQRGAFAPLRRIALTILATALLAAVVVALGTCDRGASGRRAYSRCHRGGAARRGRGPRGESARRHRGRSGGAGPLVQ